MGVSRQGNWLGQQRVDVPHLRALESAVAADVDAITGNLMAGNRALVIKGLKLGLSGILGNPATSLQLEVAGGAIMHPLASEAGSLFFFDVDAAPEVLSTSNPRIVGGFAPNVTNYIGLDLRRTADAETADIVMFLDPVTKKEVPKTVPLARTLDYRIVISTVDFATATHICPIAKVVLSGSNVFSVEDARSMLFRLGSGGSFPNRANAFTWPAGRTEGLTTANLFSGGDKELASEKDWKDAIMTRLWDLGGGERWYAPTSDRDVKLTFGQPTLGNGDNFLWTLGTSTIQWTSLKLGFANSTALTNSITNGSTTLADGECLYVDVIRGTDASVLTMQKAARLTLGAPTVPGSRFVIAWRIGTEVYIKDKPYEAGRTFAPLATNIATGTVKPSYVAGTPSDPVVAPRDANGSINNVAAAGNSPGFFGTGVGTGAGVAGIAAADGAFGVTGAVGAGATNAGGGQFTGKGTGHGVTGIAGTAAASSGVFGSAATTGSFGGRFTGVGNSSIGQGGGIIGTATGTAGAGVVGFGSTIQGVGVYGEGGGSVANPGVGLRGLGTFGGNGAVATGDAAGAGVVGTGGATSGTGVQGIGGGPNGAGVTGTGTGTGAGLQADAGGIQVGSSTNARFFEEGAQWARGMDFALKATGGVWAAQCSRTISGGFFWVDPGGTTGAVRIKPGTFRFASGAVLVLTSTVLNPSVTGTAGMNYVYLTSAAALVVNTTAPLVTGHDGNTDRVYIGSFYKDPSSGSLSEVTTDTTTGLRSVRIRWNTTAQDTPAGSGVTLGASLAATLLTASGNSLSSTINLQTTFPTATQILISVGCYLTPAVAAPTGTQFNVHVGNSVSAVFSAPLPLAADWATANGTTLTTSVRTTQTYMFETLVSNQQTGTTSLFFDILGTAANNWKVGASLTVVGYREDVNNPRPWL